MNNHIQRLLLHSFIDSSLGILLLFPPLILFLLSTSIASTTSVLCGFALFNPPLLCSQSFCPLNLPPLNVAAILVLGGGHRHASLSGLIRHPRSWQPGSPRGANGEFFSLLLWKTWILSSTFSLCRGPSWSGLIRGSLHEWCGRGKREEEKLPNSSALLIAEMKYDLFRNMQIQQSLCLVYQRDLLIQSLRERERRTIPTIKASLQCMHALRHIPANKSVVLLWIKKWRVSDNFLVVSQLQILNLLWWDWCFGLRSNRNNRAIDV